MCYNLKCYEEKHYHIFVTPFLNPYYTGYKEGSSTVKINIFLQFLIVITQGHPRKDVPSPPGFRLESPETLPMIGRLKTKQKDKISLLTQYLEWGVHRRVSSLDLKTRRPSVRGLDTGWLVFEGPSVGKPSLPRTLVCPDYRQKIKMILPQTTRHLRRRLHRISTTFLPTVRDDISKFRLER